MQPDLSPIGWIVIGFWCTMTYVNIMFKEYEGAAWCLMLGLFSYIFVALGYYC